MASPLRVVHLIERLTLGGAGRALIAAAERSVAAGRTHRIVSLQPPHPAAAERARNAGMVLADDAQAEVASADVVHIHFWNTPDLHALLRQPFAPCRIVLTCHVRGSTLPHILTPELVSLADLVLATSPDTVPFAGPHARLAPSSADLSRVANVRAVPHDGFVIGTIGTLDFAKLHPDFVAMHAALEIPGLRLLICGDGPARATLAAQIRARGLESRFELCGQVEDIASPLSACDVFGYPLCPDTYATTELVVHEAMAAGLACVVLAEGGPAHAIEDGVTGFVVHDPADYASRIRQLHDDPALRARIGRAAADHARAHFGAEHCAALVDAAYDDLMRLAPRARPGGAALTGRAALVASLGDHGAPFERSLVEDPNLADTADAWIVANWAALAAPDSGGVIHYRRAYPNDAALRYWSGLVLLGQGRPALAASEFKASRDLGFATARAEARLAEAVAAARLGVSAAGKSALSTVRERAG